MLYILTAEVNFIVSSAAFVPLWSILSTLNAQILSTKVLFGSFSHLHVTREKLLKRHSYKKCARKTLMKLPLDLR
jgi:hypothetical protein